DRALTLALVARIRTALLVRVEISNFIIWLIVLFSLPRIYSLFRKRTEEEQHHFEVTPAQRWTMSVLYFGLIAIPLFGLQVAQKDLNKYGVRFHATDGIPTCDNQGAVA